MCISSMLERYGSSVAVQGTALCALACATAMVACSASAQPQKPDTSSNATWVAIGFNSDRIAAAWVQLKSYEFLNENSFRMNAKFTNEKGTQIVGRIDLNCRNKDYYFRPLGISFQGAPWASVPNGSGIESVAKMYCKRTAAKAEWGYTPSTSYLWDAPLPTEDPSNAKGEWILVLDSDEGEAYYNDRVKIDNGIVTYAQYSRAKKGERSAANPTDSSQYTWIRTSCKENLGSFFFKPDISVDGVWLPPTPGAPNGTGIAVRRKYCK